MPKLNEIRNSIEAACQSGPLYEDKALTGMSGRKMIATLQHLGKCLVSEKACYLEVGVFQGLTLLSVGKTIERGYAIGIDDFAHFDKTHENENLVRERIKKLGLQNIELINSDYEDALENLDNFLKGRKVSLYFVDGPHDYRSQLMCLLLIQPFLTEEAVIVIDDCNYAHVRQANRDFLVSHPEFRLIFESYTDIHPANVRRAQMNAQKPEWWDGVNILFKDSYATLTNREYPPTQRDRILFENDHLVHGARYPSEVPRFLGLINAIQAGRPISFVRQLAWVVRKRTKPKLEGQFDSLNTFSNGLPVERFIS